MYFVKPTIVLLALKGNGSLLAHTISTHNVDARGAIKTEFIGSKLASAPSGIAGIKFGLYSSTEKKSTRNLN